MDYMKKYAESIFKGLSSSKINILFKEYQGSLQFKEVGFDKSLDLIADKIEILRKAKGKIYFFGNGASCSFAEHMSADFFKNAGVNTKTSSETTYLTAVLNDLGADRVFSHNLTMSAESKDMVFAISSSGNSQNIVNACVEARKMGLFIVTLSGMNINNKLYNLGDINIHTPLNSYGLVESTHPIILHMILDFYLDKYRGGRK